MLQKRSLTAMRLLADFRFKFNPAKSFVMSLAMQLKSHVEPMRNVTLGSATKAVVKTDTNCISVKDM